MAATKKARIARAHKAAGLTLRKRKRVLRKGVKRVELWMTKGKTRTAWYFHVRNRNGRITEPSQGYANPASARRAAKRDCPGLPVTSIGVRA